MTMSIHMKGFNEVFLYYQKKCQIVLNLRFKEKKNLYEIAKEEIDTVKKIRHIKELFGKKKERRIAKWGN